MMYGLKAEDFDLLQNLVVEPLTQIGAEIWIFGSRARGDHREFSDIDILYQIPKVKIPSGLIFDIKSKVEDSKLPIKMDLVHIDNLAESYRDNVIKERLSWGKNSKSLI